MPEFKKYEGISMIVPVYNEATSVKHVIENLIDVLNHLNRPFELIVVNDGSTDGTAEILDAFSGRIKVLRHLANRGYGAAIKTGIGHSCYPFVAITDADGTYPNEELPRLLAGMEVHDMVVGARTGGKVHVPLIRRPAKWLLNRIANYLVDMKIPDLNSGFRVFRKKVAEHYFHILPNGFSFTTTITLAMISDGYQVHYESIDYYKREGRSKIKPVDALNFLIFIVRTITYFNPLRVFLPICLALFGLGMVRFCYDIFWLHNLTDSTTLLFLFALQVCLIGIVADLIVKRSRP
jgi:glycosyltransferase involved in cell wall biosynthesis